MEPGHEFYEVAGAVAGVQLPLEDVVPGVFDGAGAAWEGEEECALGDAGEGAGLHRGGADLLVAEHAEEFAEAFDAFFDDPVEGFGRDVAAGDAGAAGADDDVDVGVGDPAAEVGFDGTGVVALDGAGGDLVAGGLDAGFQRIAGAVVGEGSGIRDGQDGDGDGNEAAGLVDGQGWAPLAVSADGPLAGAAWCGPGRGATGRPPFRPGWQKVGPIGRHTTMNRPIRGGRTRGFPRQEGPP